MKILLLITLSLSLPYFAVTSECVVSEWTLWSGCFGGCKIGKMVRNRDVLEPPLPELNANGLGPPFLRRCPHLYETRSCPSCQDKLEESLKNVKDKETKEEEDLVKQLEEMDKVARMMGTDMSSGEIGNETNAENSRSENNEKWRSELPIRKIESTSASTTTKQLLMSGHDATTTSLPENNQIVEIDESTTTTTVDVVPTITSITYPTLVTSTATTTTTAAAPNDSEQSFKLDGLATETTTSFVKPQPEENNKMKLEEKPVESYFVNSIVIDLPRRKQPNYAITLKNNEREDSGNEKGIETVLKDIEKAASGESDRERKRWERIKKKLQRKKMNRNKIKTSNWKRTTKPVATAAMKMSAWKRFGLKRIKVTSGTTPWRASTSTTLRPRWEGREMARSEKTYWHKRKNYIPNTRKHASDITAQLYMTHKIVQALKEDSFVSKTLPMCPLNRRCCKVERVTCSDGSTPSSYVLRYYRPPGSSTCEAYRYPRCSQAEEFEERPIQFEQNCQDLCFDVAEKRISPLFALNYDEDEYYIH